MECPWGMVGHGQALAEGGGLTLRAAVMALVVAAVVAAAPEAHHK